MKIIFGTTNKRKINDLKELICEKNLNIEVLTLNDIDWNLGEIEENGTSLEENSLLKAKTIYSFCKKNNLTFPILTDDAGLFVKSLNNEPGIYTARYADNELKENPKLPPYQCLIKLLNNLKPEMDRTAIYKCVVTCMYSDGTYFQCKENSNGKIAQNITEPIIKPYFYSLFILDDCNKTFNQLKKGELKDTYRHKALIKVLNLMKK